MAKIMIVDDDRTTTSLLEMLLELDGYEVIVVSMGANVIPTAEKDTPDLFLMDYHLTDMHGVDILRDLRVHATLKDIPVIIASGMNVEDEVMAAGANEFLIKPFEPGDLPIMFEKLING
ncbi:MAG: response regulator [Aggregatilineales bacterium]